MNLKYLNHAVSTATVFAAFGLAASLHADSVSLVPGGSVTPPPPGPISTPISGTTVASSLVSFFSETLSGKLGTTVLSGVTSNELGGLTFVYEFKNISSAVDAGGKDIEGITNFSLGGWAPFKTDFALGNSFFYGTSGTPVAPGKVQRSSFAFDLGDTIDVPFRSFFGGPPIFNGQNSYQLILFTDASAWTTTSGLVDTANFEARTTWVQPVSTFTATAATNVPEVQTTTVLVGLGLLSLSVLGRRWNRA